MEIKTIKSISEMFSVFHDGAILNFQHHDDICQFDVEIEYLTKRINPNFTKFKVVISGVGSFRFVTWPKDSNDKPQVFCDINTIFKPNLEILSGATKGNQVQVSCNQLGDFYYCGGELYFLANSAIVTDENNKSYSLKELKNLSKEYWEEWSSKSHRNKKYIKILNWIKNLFK